MGRRSIFIGNPMPLTQPQRALVNRTRAVAMRRSAVPQHPAPAVLAGAIALDQLRYRLAPLAVVTIFFATRSVTSSCPASGPPRAA